MVSDNAVTTRFDESLISALKRAWPSELVITTGKVRGVVGWSMRELREGRGVASDSDSMKSTSDPMYDGMGVAVCTEWKSSTVAWKLVMQVKMGLGHRGG